MFAFYARKTLKKWHYISTFYRLYCVLLYLQTGVPQMLCSKMCSHVCIISRIGDNWAATWDFRATSKGSDQPAHTRSLIRAFVSRLTILWLRYWPKLELSRLIWVWADSSESALVKISQNGRNRTSQLICSGELRPLAMTLTQDVWKLVSRRWTSLWTIV